MNIPEFKYDGYWRDESRGDWKRRGLHWHCHNSRMDGSTYSNEPIRQDLATEYAPKVIRDWLGKPVRTIQATPTTPEEAIDWLRSQWEPIKTRIGQDAYVIPEEARFGIALFDLRCGNDVCWGFWIGSSTHLQLAIVGTHQKCH